MMRQTARLQARCIEQCFVIGYSEIYTTSALIDTKYGIFALRKALGKHAQTIALNECATHHTPRPILRHVTLVLFGGSLHSETTRTVPSNFENRGHVPTAGAVVWH